MSIFTSKTHLLNFSSILISWYLTHKRDLPWRTTKDPYKIWLSEIILQQTRVEQGLPYYQNFIAQHPNIKSLASAPEEEILKLWQGLGYYSRARNLHFTAKYISTNLKGVFPNTFDEIKKLKGIGDYTASAIGSICFGLPTAVVDGNVYRALSRYYGISTPINSTAGIKEFKALAQSLIPKKDPATFNQAIMEFGARQCKPKNPDCTVCPMQEGCFAFRENEIQKLPVKIKKIKIKHRYFHYLVVLSNNNKTIIEKRHNKGIWEGLYQFPLVETDNETTPPNFRKIILFNDSLSQYLNIQDVTSSNITQYNTSPIIHKLSHQHLHTTFWILEIENIKDGISWKDISNYAVPALIANFINAFKPSK